MKKRKLPPMSIAELQKLLEEEEDVPLQIMPDGSIVQGGRKTKIKPLTMKERLGGEYAEAA